MAKSSKSRPAKSDRRAVVDQLRSQQRNSERRRNFTIVGVCVVVALLIVGAAAFRPLMNWWDMRQFNGADLASIGAAASVCQEVETRPASGEADHVVPGTHLDYEDSPPAFGRHWENWDAMERKFYTAAERPPVGQLVHSLEHGYTFLWYDETAAADDAMLKDIRGMARALEGTGNMRLKFKAVPWTSEDGDPFPEGQHIAFTHWSIGGAENQGSTSEQQGVWQYCSEPSGEALHQFMLDYPYMDSPEPYAG